MLTQKNSAKIYGQVLEFQTCNIQRSIVLL